MERLAELEPATRLLVLGRRGEAAHVAPQHLGSNLERVIRAMHRPMLVVPPVFEPVRNFMLAFDGSATTRKGADTLAASPLFQGLSCHLVMVAESSADTRASLAWASHVFEAAGFATTAVLRAGDVETELTRYQRDHDVDVVVMGAYGHSRIRHLLVGSTTTAMIRALPVPVLLLR